MHTHLVIPFDLLGHLNPGLHNCLAFQYSGLYLPLDLGELHPLGLSKLKFIVNCLGSKKDPQDFHYFQLVLFQHNSSVKLIALPLVLSIY